MTRQLRSKRQDWRHPPLVRQQKKKTREMTSTRFFFLSLFSFFTRLICSLSLSTGLQKMASNGPRCAVDTKYRYSDTSLDRFWKIQKPCFNVMRDKAHLITDKKALYEYLREGLHTCTTCERLVCSAKSCTERCSSCSTDVCHDCISKFVDLETVTISWNREDSDAEPELEFDIRMCMRCAEENGADEVLERREEFATNKKPKTEP